jgi:hypothetical protein
MGDLMAKKPRLRSRPYQCFPQVATRVTGSIPHCFLHRRLALSRGDLTWSSNYTAKRSNTEGEPREARVSLHMARFLRETRSGN